MLNRSSKPSARNVPVHLSKKRVSYDPVRGARGRQRIKEKRRSGVQSAVKREGHLRRWPLHGKSGRRVKKAGFRKPALQQPILPSGAIDGTRGDLARRARFIVPLLVLRNCLITKRESTALRSGWPARRPFFDAGLISVVVFCLAGFVDGRRILL